MFFGLQFEDTVTPYYDNPPTDNPPRGDNPPTRQSAVTFGTTIRQHDKPPT